jgi:hypothetical protein
MLALACMASPNAATAESLKPPIASTLALRTHLSGEWSLDTPPAGVILELSGVSCTSASWCLAVGASDVSGGSSPSTAVAGVWSGATWAPTSTLAVPIGSSGAILMSVSCVSTTFCVAAGYTERGSNNEAMTEEWNGTAWIHAAIATLKGIRVSQFRSVSCASSLSCTAVGDGVKGLDTAVSIGEHFNGSTWTAQSIPFPNGATDVEVAGVSCPSVSVCVAVGSMGNRSPSSGAEFTLADRWNGVSWAMLSSVNEPHDLYRYFNSVSCSSNVNCVAVGADTSPSGVNTTLSEVLRGTTWAVATTPSTAGGEFRDLYGVSCFSTSDCIAVGFDETVDRVYLTLIDQWNGSAWALQSTPSTSGATYSELFGASCPTSINCEAVGTGVALSGLFAGSATTTPAPPTTTTSKPRPATLTLPNPCLGSRMAQARVDLVGATDAPGFELAQGYQSTGPNLCSINAPGNQLGFLYDGDVSAQSFFGKDIAGVLAVPSYRSESIPGFPGATLFASATSWSNRSGSADTSDWAAMVQFTRHIDGKVFYGSVFSGFYDPDTCTTKAATDDVEMAASQLYDDFGGTPLSLKMPSSPPCKY